MPACRSCRAAIIFVPTKSGKRMPIDPEPYDDGNVVLRVPAGMMGSGEKVAHLLADTEAPLEGELRFRSHFASCPNAKRHRRRR